jgi:hypothetical protein
MDNIKEYIKNVLDTNGIEVEMKDGLYHITIIYDAKESHTLSALYETLKLTEKLRLQSKLKTYLPESYFKLHTETVNQPKPILKRWNNEGVNKTK